MRGVLFYVPIDVAQTPANGEALVNRWWTVHPEKGVAFYYRPFSYERSEDPAPQCNPTEHVARRLQERLWPGHQIQQIPVVFMQHAIRAMAEDKAARRKTRPA